MLPDVLEVRALAARHLERDHVRVHLVQQLQRRLVGLDLGKHPLLRRVAPARVAPHLGLRPQPLHRVVEHLQHELGVDHRVLVAARRQQVNLRLFHLDDRAPRIRQVVQLLVERVAHRQDARRQVLVVLVLHRKRHQLRRHRPELHRLARQALRRFPDLRILHLAGAQRPDDLRHHARFEVVVQDVPARKPDAARAHLRQLRMRRVEPAHVVRRIARPALPTHVLVEPAVPVGHDVQPGDFLLAQIHRQRIHILLAEAADHHRVQKRFQLQILGIPARTRQRARDRRGHHQPSSRFQHDSVSLDAPLAAHWMKVKVNTGQLR